MARAARPTREVPEVVQDQFEIDAAEYLTLKAQIARLTKRQKELRDTLIDRVLREGEEDADGYLVIELPREIDGTRFLQRQVAVSHSLDMEAAETILNEHQLWGSCVELVPQINEDAVLAAVFDGELSQDEFDQIYVRKETPRLVAKK